MWIVVLKGREYVEDKEINGRIEMCVEGRVMVCVDCICLTVSGDQRWDVQNTQIKHNML
jgi:hypothetical protein